MIVTLFGDLVQEPDAKISGPLMSLIFDHLGIRPEAMRVALHRLRKNGWIVSEKVGRTGFYRLSDHGRAQTVTASARIYARQIQWQDRWHVAIAPPMAAVERAAFSKSLLALGYVAINAAAYVGNGVPGPAVDDCFVFAGADMKIPDWLRSDLVPDGMGDAFGQLESAMAVVENNLIHQAELTVLETAALRILVVHDWRYLVLRCPNLPEWFYPVDWRENQCRTLVHNVLNRLEKPTIKGMQVHLK